MAASPELERLAEDGNNVPISKLFNASPGAVYDNTVGMAPICPGESATLSFEINLVPKTVHYFSFATMILPSNDAFLANGNPQAYRLFDRWGFFRPVFIRQVGTDALDAGTEENTESTETTAFFGQSSPNTGQTSNGVVELHPGFNPVGSGGILDSKQFVNGDFTSPG